MLETQTNISQESIIKKLHEHEAVNSTEEFTGFDIEYRKYLLDLPLGKILPEIYNDAWLKHCALQGIKLGGSTYLDLNFRLALEDYLSSNKSKTKLEEVEKAILLYFSSEYPPNADGLQNKAAGTYICPIKDELICQIWLTEDTNLINLCQKHFGISPTPQLFTKLGFAVPHNIKANELAGVEALAKIKSEDFPVFERDISTLQGLLREKQRFDEENVRIASRYARYLKDHKKSAHELIEDANTPYTPIKCSPELAQRIVQAASKVSAFSTVKHITHATSLLSILDDALYGRRTLKDRCIPFNPAALHGCDVLNGDADVVCLGPQDIDPQAAGDIIIEFDLAKIQQSRSVVFYKQLDLEYLTKEKIRTVKLGKLQLHFDHTGLVRNPDPLFSELQIFSDRHTLLGGACLPKSSLISYNLPKMHQILALNFFKFIDQLDNPRYIEDFYNEIARLNEHELVQFLTDLEKNMTDTAEFNFYGAHQIDFSTILKISKRKESLFKMKIKYTLDLPEFINSLQENNINALRDARKNLPELFKSYRFLDFLLLTLNRRSVGDIEVIYYLENLRGACKTPDWMPPFTPKPIPESVEICWEVTSPQPVEVYLASTSTTTTSPSEVSDDLPHSSSNIQDSLVSTTTVASATSSSQDLFGENELGLEQEINPVFLNNDSATEVVLASTKTTAISASEENDHLSDSSNIQDSLVSTTTVASATSSSQDLFGENESGLENDPATEVVLASTKTTAISASEENDHLSDSSNSVINDYPVIEKLHDAALEHPRVSKLLLFSIAGVCSAGVATSLLLAAPIGIAIATGAAGIAGIASMLIIVHKKVVAHEATVNMYLNNAAGGGSQTRTEQSYRDAYAVALQNHRPSLAETLEDERKRKYSALH